MIIRVAKSPPSNPKEPPVNKSFPLLTSIVYTPFGVVPLTGKPKTFP